MVSSIFLLVYSTSFDIWEETMSFEEVASKLIAEEGRLKSEYNTSSNSVFVARAEPYVNKNNGMVLKCWKCGNSEHVRFKCPIGEK